MTQDFKKFLKKFFDIFVLLITFEILSHYPNIDISHWLKEDLDHTLRKIYGLNGFDTFLSQFSFDISVFAGFFRCF